MTQLVEKPDPRKAPSNLAIIGRYVLTPKIFDKLEQTQRGAGEEIQLTDAIQAMMQEQGVYAYEFEGTRYDAGTTMGWLKASVELALQRPDLGREFRSSRTPALDRSDRGHGVPCRPGRVARALNHVEGRRGARLAEIGTILGGRYRLVELLGEGGMAPSIGRSTPSSDATSPSSCCDPSTCAIRTSRRASGRRPRTPLR